MKYKYIITNIIFLPRIRPTLLHVMYMYEYYCENILISKGLIHKLLNNRRTQILHGDKMKLKIFVD